MISKNKLFNRLFIVAALTLIYRGIAHGETNFSGFTGIKANFYSKENEEKFDPSLSIDAFFAGQFNFGKSFLLRTELSVTTGDILNDNIFKGTSSDFSVDEISFTFRKSVYHTANYLSVFLGTYEPVGSDVFLQRLFGIGPISSALTNNWMGLNGNYVFPFFGMGASYVLKIEPVPIALGFYIYYNKENPADSHQMNFDLRFATVWSGLTLDFACGVGIPVGDKKSNGDDALLVIDTVFMHMGWNLMFGNNYSGAALLFQGGFESLPIRAGEVNNKLQARDVKVIFEPRFRGPKCNIYLSLYSLPKATLKKTLILDGTMGFDLHLFSDKIPAKTKDITFGVHTMLSFNELNFMDVAEIGEAFTDEAFNIKLAPYIALPVARGTFNAMLQLNVGHLMHGRKAECVKLNLGFKTQI